MFLGRKRTIDAALLSCPAQRVTRPWETTLLRKSTRRTLCVTRTALDVYVGLDAPAFALDQRVRAAFCAILLRCSGVSLYIRAFPPFRPKATALGSLSFFFDMRSDLTSAQQ
jgi:hypothetical protein